MSYYKRNRRGGGPGQRSPEGPAVSELAQILLGKEFNIRKEVDHIVELASRGEARIVTAGALVFFSTGDGDAWALDAEDNLALCLMRDFERCDVEIHDDPQSFAIRWDSTFAIEGGCFWVSPQPGRAEPAPQSPAVLRMKTVAYPSYPVSELERGIRRARQAARLP